MAGRDDPGNKFDDLFEDLDKFFAPIEQVDRPLRDDQAAEAADPAEAADGVNNPKAADPPENPAAGADPDPDDHERAAPAPLRPPQETSEMTGEDWDRLRDA